MHAGCQLLDGEPGILLQGTQDGEVGLVKCIHEREYYSVWGVYFVPKQNVCSVPSCKYRIVFHRFPVSCEIFLPALTLHAVDRGAVLLVSCSSVG